jgi:bacillithiol biosynthesis cysteine-adding enzyme BshC
MHKFIFNRQLTGLFTDQQNQLAYNQEQVLPFIGQPFSLENYTKQIVQKEGNYSKENRTRLVQVLNVIYAQTTTSDLQQKNLRLLENTSTFTITTGHQLSIFTGPIYFIYKILHVIRSTEELNRLYPENHFVPVFWMASEDHDFEEIQSVEVFNSQMKWSSDQKGPVGRFKLDGLDALKEEIAGFFENQPESEIQAIFDAYDGANLGEATFNLVNKLFADYGLIVVDGDQSELKKAMIPLVEKEIKEQFSFHAVQKTNEKIQKEGLKLQVNAREINLFYIEDQIRERILQLEDGFFIEGKGKFSLDELTQLLHTKPACFSPNVILRPVYQELILPNLCYVGGVGEISYWLQLKGVFDALELTFPMIQVRSSLLWIDTVTSKRIEKAEMVLEDLFKDSSDAKKQYLAENASHEIDFEKMDGHFEELRITFLDKIEAIDPNLDKYARAETVKMQKQLDAIKDKLTRSVKQRHDAGLKAIDQIFDKLYPNGGMQERTLNLISMCADGKVKAKINQLHSFIDPFDPDFVIIREA